MGPLVFGGCKIKRSCKVYKKSSGKTSIGNGCRDGVARAVARAGFEACYISGGATVTMTCCILGELEAWNILPIIENDDCSVSTASVTWGGLKSQAQFPGVLGYCRSYPGDFS